jgi:hypothetical protein
MVQSDWYSLIGGFLGGGVIASTITQWVIGNRERRDRKNDFRGFLGHWLSDIQRIPAGDTAKTYEAYIANVRAFSGYAGKLNRDFPFKKKRFKTMCKDLGTLEPKHIHNDAGDCREIVARKIEALIDLV